MSGLFSSGFLNLETAMVAREKLQTTHASNIANADTPNYQADTRTFADMFAIEQARRSQIENGQFSFCISCHLLSTLISGPLLLISNTVRDRNPHKHRLSSMRPLCIDLRAISLKSVCDIRWYNRLVCPLIRFL